VRETTDILKEGDEVTVKVIDIDDQGKVRLSRKAVIMEAPDYDPAQYAGMGVPAGTAHPGGDRERGHDHDRGGGRGGPSRGGRGGRDRGGRHGRPA
jgi:polyribonucleotide nucleotidyltransferase